MKWINVILSDQKYVHFLEEDQFITKHKNYSYKTDQLKFFINKINK